MTCAVGVEAQGGVWMAADSKIGNTHYCDVTADVKLVPIGGNPRMVFGASGLPRVAAAIALIRAPRRPRTDTDYSYVCRTLEAILADLRASETPLELALVVGYHGRIYEIDSALSVTRSVYGYAATGSGYPYALGSLASTSGDAKKRAVSAVAAACRHCPTVGEPIVTRWVAA